MRGAPAAEAVKTTAAAETESGKAIKAGGLISIATTWLNESGVTTASTGGPGRMGGGGPGGNRVRPEQGTP
ncbi:hypothetical protein [Paenibacillus caseinilyticus]|uniref:hypothetical protein n=1 Tax=Paenibacillus caseinilyticus TaxID=3098138 RepID=UPI0022B8B849|nr:hypothetical protein [Paenibacillus caseinilyticus]MCZ8522491.1 hypothetical protein [Paenibacillus caseinilyticus]